MGTYQKKNGSARLALGALFAMLLLRGPLYHQAIAAEDQDDPEKIFRYDPVFDSLIAIERDELKVGYIYNHFSQRLNRRVYSYWQASGEFWHAFGEGTTQEAWKFDVPESRQEALQRLRETDPELAMRLDRAATPVRLRLNAEGTWDKVGNLETISIYDIETLHRWEKHTNRYVLVITTHDIHWLVHDGRYVPAGRLVVVK
jgi:hypothetical protein